MKNVFSAMWSSVKSVVSEIEGVANKAASSVFGMGKKNAVAPTIEEIQKKVDDMQRADDRARDIIRGRAAERFTKDPEYAKVPTSAPKILSPQEQYEKSLKENDPNAMVEAVRLQQINQIPKAPTGFEKKASSSASSPKPLDQVLSNRGSTVEEIIKSAKEEGRLSKLQKTLDRAPAVPTNDPKKRTSTIEDILKRAPAAPTHDPRSNGR